MHISTISVRGFSIRVGTTSVPEPRRPLLLFNGIGASIELVVPFTEAMQRVGIPSVVFDIPGVGGSERTLMPYRFSELAKLADSVLDAQSLRAAFATRTAAEWERIAEGRDVPLAKVAS